MSSLSLFRFYSAFLWLRLSFSLPISALSYSSVAQSSNEFISTQLSYKSIILFKCYSAFLWVYYLYLTQHFYERRCYSVFLWVHCYSCVALLQVYCLYSSFTQPSYEFIFYPTFLWVYYPFSESSLPVRTLSLSKFYLAFFWVFRFYLVLL